MTTIGRLSGYPWWVKKSNEQVPSELTQKQVLEASSVELKKIVERRVHKIVDRSEMEATPNMVLLSAKWLITNKGTKEKSKPKARFVVREFATGAIERDILPSGTPGLPIVGSLISKAATSWADRRKRKTMLVDVMVAFLYGFCEGPLFMEVPDADPAAGDLDKVA